MNQLSYQTVSYQKKKQQKQNKTKHQCFYLQLISFENKYQGNILSLMPDNHEEYKWVATVYSNCHTPSILWSSNDLIFCFSAKILKPCKVRSLKFPHQLQNYLANTFLSSLLFIIPHPFFKSKKIVHCPHHYFFALCLSIVSHIYNFYFLTFLLFLGGEAINMHISKTKQCCSLIFSWLTSPMDLRADFSEENWQFLLRARYEPSNSGITWVLVRNAGQTCCYHFQVETALEVTNFLMAFFPSYHFPDLPKTDPALSCFPLL